MAASAEKREEKTPSCLPSFVPSSGLKQRSPFTSLPLPGSRVSAEGGGLKRQNPLGEDDDQEQMDPIPQAVHRQSLISFRPSLVTNQICPSIPAKCSLQESMTGSFALRGVSLSESPTEIVEGNKEKSQDRKERNRCEKAGRRGGRSRNKEGQS